MNTGDQLDAHKADRAHAVRVRVTAGYDGLKKRWVRMLLSAGASSSEAEEYAHAAIVETYLGAHRVVTPEAVPGYGATIARRSLWRERRRTARSSPVAPPELPEEPSQSPVLDVALQRDDLLRVMAKAFANVSQRDRDMLWQRYVDGASCDEVARTHGLAPSSVPTLLLRIRQRLRDLLGPHNVRQQL